MNLKLSKPIAFFDLETTGVNIAKDKIVEVFVLKVMPNGDKHEYYSLVNPKIPIPAETSAIHGITDEKVANEPTFFKIAFELNDFLADCDLAGFNSNYFDIPLLKEEFYRVGIDFNADNRQKVDVFKIFTKMEPRDLSSAYKFYCGKNLEDAHTAKADVYATYEILEAQISKYEGKIENDIAKLNDFTADGNFVDSGRRFIKDKGVVKFNFGKHKGKPVTEVLKKEPMYYDWMMKSEFLLDTKQKLKEIRDKLYSSN